MNKALLTCILAFTLILGFASAHGPGDETYIEVVNKTNNTYMFSCSLPDNSGPARTWTIREDHVSVEHESQTTANLFNYTFNNSALYHIGCQTLHEDGDLVRGDFHIDLREAPNTNIPNINITHADGLDFSATCTHPTATNYELRWKLINYAGTTNLDEFNNTENITTQVPYSGLWDVDCSVYDLDTNNFTQFGLPIEFYESGPAYVPNAEGCRPGTCMEDMNAVVNWTGGPINITLNQLTNTSPINVSIQVEGFTVSEDGSGDGHVHLYVDGVKVNRVYTDSKLISISPGQHTIEVRLASNSHAEYAINGSIINESITVDVPIGDQVPPSPDWIEPSQNTNDMDPFDFHIHLFPIAPEYEPHLATDFEIWDQESGERIWAALNSTILEHIHRGDGEFFSGNYTTTKHLKYDHPYSLRARYNNPNGNGEWSEWRNFTTTTEPNFTASPYDWTAMQGYTVEVVAENVNLPTTIEPAPDIYDQLNESDQPKFYVTHLYGQLGMFTKDGTYHEYASDLLNFESFGSLPGSGEIGVTGMLVDETSGDLFVTMVYWDSTVNEYKGKIERFHTNANGTSYTNRTILLDNITASPSHQIQGITRGPDDKLYVHVGDADRVGETKDPSKFPGKVLRMNEDGTIPDDNPYPGTYTYVGGLRNSFDGAWNPDTNQYFISNNGPDENDGIYKTNPGDIFGWCCDTAEQLWHRWPNSVAPTGMIFDAGTNSFEGTQGTLFSVMSGKTYTQGPSLEGKRIAQFEITEDGGSNKIGDLVTYTGEGFSAPIDATFLDDGLYFTDLYGPDGFVGVGQTNGQILRVIPGNQNETNQTNQSQGFRTGIGPAAWYPQGLNVVWECKPREGSGDYKYTYHFGDGNSQWNVQWDNVYKTYPDWGTYQVSCIVTDQQTQEQATAITSITLADPNAPPEDNQTNTTETNQTGSNQTNTTGYVADITGITVFDPLANTASMLLAQGDTLDLANYLQGFGLRASLGVGNVTNVTFTIDTTSFTDSTAPYEVEADLTEGDYQLQAATNWMEQSSTFSINFSIINTTTPASNQTNTTNQTENNNTNTTQDYCPASIADVAVSCVNSELTQDITTGCRHVTCEGATGAVTILACDKPNSENANYFEVYQQASSGYGVDVCLGELCMNGWGFKQSENYGVCEEPEIEDNSIQYLGSVEEIFVEGLLGSVVAKDGQSYNVNILGIPLQARSQFQGHDYAEIYVNYQSIGEQGVNVGTEDEIATSIEYVEYETTVSAIAFKRINMALLDETTLIREDSSIARNITLINTTNDTVVIKLTHQELPTSYLQISSGDRDSNDGMLIVVDTVNSTNAELLIGELEQRVFSFTNQTLNNTASLELAPWYPQGTHTVLYCNEQGFTATSYTWDFGDGNTQTTTNNNVYHIYPGAGSYQASCTATGEGAEASALLEVQI